MRKRNFSSLLLEPVSAYLELTLTNPIKTINQVSAERSSAERSKLGRVRKNSSSLIKIVRSQEMSPEVDYKMKPVGPISRPRVTVIA